jgi:energy-converting hydrogenase B subunit P
MNPTSEPIKVEIPIFDEEWIDEHRQLGLEITPLTEQDSFLSNFRRQKMRLEQIKEK